MIPLWRFAAILACLAAAVFAQSGPYTIAGVTIEHATKQPVPRVLMTIAMTDGSGRQKACITDASGRFRFDDIPPGKYILNANRPGGFPQLFQGSGGFVTGIAVGPGRDSGHIVFELRAGASITGTVTGDDGEPTRQAQVYLFRKGVNNGTAGIHMRGMANTNASGRFHFDHLPAGTYFAAVSAQPWYAQAHLPAAGSQFDLAYSVTYYGGSTDPASAAPIVLSEGGSAKIQIALDAVPAVHVRLEGPLQGGYRMLSVIGPGGFPIRIPAQNFFVKDGYAETSGLAPGNYVMTIRRFQQGRMDILSRKLVSVQNGADPQIVDEPAASVSGKVIFTPPDRPPDIGIVLAPISSGRQQRATIPPGGSFQFADIAPGKYRIGLTNGLEFRIVQVIAKDAEYASGILQIAPGAKAQLSVTAARAESHVEGIALKNGKPFPGAMVLLVPLDMKTDQYVGRDQSDSDGTFSVLHVPDGRYILLAIDNGADLAYRDPDVIGPYKKEGVPVNVPASNGRKLRIGIVPRRK